MSYDSIFNPGVEIGVERVESGLKLGSKELNRGVEYLELSSCQHFPTPLNTLSRISTLFSTVEIKASM